MSIREEAFEQIEHTGLHRLLGLQRELMDMVARERPLGDRLPALCRLFEDSVPGMVASVMQLDRQGRLQFICAPSVPREILQHLDHVKPGVGAGSCAYAAWSGAPAYVGDAQTDARWASLHGIARAHQIRACWSAPVRTRDRRVIGTFALTAFESRLPDAFHRQLLDLGATTIGLLFDQQCDHSERDVANSELRRLTQVADATPNGVVLTDMQGRITWANDGMRALTGHASEALTGKQVGEILAGPQTDSDGLRCMQEAIAKGKPYADTLILYGKDGTRLTSQVTCTPRFDSHGACEGAMVMYVDVSALKRLSEFNALLARVSDAIAHEDDSDMLMQTICELAVRHAGFKLVWIGRPDADTGWFRPLAVAGPEKAYLDEIRISGDASVPEGRGPSGQAWRDGKNRYNDSFQATPGLRLWAEAARKHKFAASATLTIRRNGEVWAILAVYHELLESFDKALQEVLETLASNISRGLDRIDLIRREHELLALNQSMLDSAMLGVTLTRDRVIQRANRRAAEILGAGSAEALVGIHVGQLYPSEQTSKSIAAHIKSAFERHERAIFETPVVRLDGRSVWLRLDGAPFERDGFDEIWTLIDITEQHQSLESQTLMANALEAVQEGVLISDARQQTVYVNPAFEALTGYGIEAMRGRSCNLLQGPDTDPATVTRIRESLDAGRAFTGEILNYTRQGQAFWNLLTINPLRDDAGVITHFVGVQQDITELRNLNTQLAYQAFHDELTGLPNRRGLDRHLDEALAIAAGAGTGLAVAIIDLDDFKTVNDVHGHACGDLLLKTITGRLRSRIRQGDYIARLGGDEFVIVFADLRPAAGNEDLMQRVQALGAGFEDPYEIRSGVRVHMGLSMGIALYREHADEAGGLLRLADEALFRAKQNKFERSQWWSIYGAGDPDTAVLEQPLEPYGESSVEVLHAAAGLLDGALLAFIEAFYTVLSRDAHAAEIIGALAEDEFQRLKRQHIQHLRFLTTPETTREALVQASTRIGRIHALSGIDNVLLMRWTTIYHDLVTTHFGTLPMSARQRYLLLQTVDHRLQDDLQAQLHAQEALHHQYDLAVDTPMPDRTTSWNQVIVAECTRISALPGISCTLVMRQNAQHMHNIEVATGTMGLRIARAMETYLGQGSASTITPPEDTQMAIAWQTATIRTVASYAAIQGAGPKMDMAAELVAAGIRSALYIPVLDDHQLPVALIIVMGRFPNQFSGKEMQYFSRGLQQRWCEIWSRITRPAPPVSQELAIAYRKRLFKSGLRMLLQPVVHLGNGDPVKVEALARLELEDGSLVGPDIFVPLLRHAELDALFRQGLDIALADLAALDAAGMHIDLSLNIAPQTLVNPECLAWVEEALARHGTPASRLTLEILENQRVDHMARDAGVRRLMDLGVKFAIDDLGSGYSSLRRLASLPFDAIKVDQDLLARLYLDPIQTVSLISAVIQIGRDFGSRVIVEGLEDIGMIEVARLLGADYGQGYAIARPMPAAAIPQWAQNYRMHAQHATLNTALGGLAFQWISIRHRSLHTTSIETCPLTPLIRGGHPDDLQYALALHQAVHADPGNTVAPKRLLDWLEQNVREDTPHA